MNVIRPFISLKSFTDFTLSIPIYYYFIDREYTNILANSGVGASKKYQVNFCDFFSWSFIFKYVFLTFFMMFSEDCALKGYKLLKLRE